MEYFEYIEAYIDGTLSEEIRVEFESALQNSVELQNAVRLFPLGKQVSSAYAELEAEEILNNIASSPAANPPKKSRSLLRYGSIAAAIVAILGCLLVFQNYNENKNRQLLSQSSIILPDLEVKRSETIPEGTKEKFLYHLHLNQFLEAEEILASFSGQTLDDQWSYYQGLLYLQQDMPARALDVFSSISNDSIKILADYHSAISELMLGNKEKSVRILENFVSPDSVMQSQARALLDHINHG